MNLTKSYLKWFTNLTDSSYLGMILEHVNKDITWDKVKEKLKSNL